MSDVELILDYIKTIHKVASCKFDNRVNSGSCSLSNELQKSHLRGQLYVCNDLETYIYKDFIYKEKIKK